MDLKTLNKAELLKIKEDVELELKNIDRIKKDSKSLKKGTLSSLKNGDKIFCICFHGSKIFNIDYVNITFYKIDGDEKWLKYSTSHPQKPMGESSGIEYECMDKHYYLHESCSRFSFYTLKPENWREDLKLELKRHTENREIKFKEEMMLFSNNINDLLDDKEVDVFINKI